MSIFWLVLLVISTHSKVNSAVVHISTSSEELPFVNISSLGAIQGTTSNSYFTNRLIYNFFGINYAQPPSNGYRFQPPQKFPPWEGVYNATKMRQRCPQVDTDYYPIPDPSQVNNVTDQEDCLVVNVFTPKITMNYEDIPLPVMFYIHGGSFYAGSAYGFSPEFLLEKDIVLVVVQYRLGALGFLSLQTDSIPGNAGMLDIILALEWVQDNIKWFGGDPTRVTVVGQSAGAAGASALLVSPMVREGLFSQMVIHSGSAQAVWAVDTDPVSPAKEISRIVHCFSTDDQEIADCLRKAPTEELVQAHMLYLQNSMSTTNSRVCNLVVQRAGGNKKFLTEPPNILFDEGKFLKVPIMGGSTRDEGSSFLTGFYAALDKNSPKYYERNMTKDVLYYLGLTDQSNAMLDFYQNKYFKGVTSFEEAGPALLDLFSVILMKAPTAQVVRRMSLFKPSYLYSFNFAGGASKLKASEPNWDDKYPFPTGVAHSDELGYLFPMERHTYTERELKMVHVMVNLWTSFIINGKPAPTEEVSFWSPMTHEYGPYLRIIDSPIENPNIFFEYEVAQREGYVTGSAQPGQSAFPIFLAITVSLLFRLC